MGKIVSINAGSTSIKMAIYDDFAIQDGQTTPLAEYRWEKDVKKATVKFGVHKYVHDVPLRVTQRLSRMESIDSREQRVSSIRMKLSLW